MSVEKTGRVVLAQEAGKSGGPSGEVAALLAEEALDFLAAPIRRVAAPDTPVPFAPVMENFYVPSAEKIVAAVNAVVSWR